MLRMNYSNFNGLKQKKKITLYLTVSNSQEYRVAQVECSGSESLILLPLDVDWYYSHPMA